MKLHILILEIKKELDEKFPIETLKKGHEIDFVQIAFIDELLKKTYDTIKEKTYSENFSMFNCKTFITECKNPEEKRYILQLSEMVTETMLKLFLMNPEYFEQHFGSNKWFNSLYELYCEEFFTDIFSQYQERVWYKKIRSSPLEQMKLL